MRVAGGQTTLPLDTAEMVQDGAGGRRAGSTRRTRRKPRIGPHVAPGQTMVMCPVCGRGPIAEGEQCGWCGYRATGRCSHRGMAEYSEQGASDDGP